jgi:hypothetical protein
MSKKHIKSDSEVRLRIRSGQPSCYSPDSMGFTARNSHVHAWQKVYMRWTPREYERLPRSTGQRLIR